MAQRDSRIEAAEKCLAAGDVDGALTIYQSILSEDPGHVWGNIGVGSVAIDLNHHAMAERYLTVALKADPRNIVGRFKMALAQAGQNRLVEAERMLEGLTRDVPMYVEFHAQLGYARHAQYKFAEAAEAWEQAAKLQPDNPHIQIRFARAAGRSYERFAEADQAFEKAALHAGDDFKMLSEIGNWYLEKRDFVRAAELLGRARACAPADELNGFFFLCLGTALRELGHTAEAAEAFDAGVRLCDDLIAEFGMTDGERPAVFKARILFAAGRRDEARAAMETIVRATPEADFTYSPKDYLDRMPERIEKLRGLIGGKDVVLTLPGPSIKNLERTVEGLRDSDTVFVSVNKFQRLEERILGKIGRTFDLLFVATNFDLALVWNDLKRFLDAPKPTMLVTWGSRFAFLDQVGETWTRFRDRYDDRLFTISWGSKVPQTPRNPLNFETLNSLSAIVPVLALGRPRRIFIFGADGGRDPNNVDEIHFDSGDVIGYRTNDVEEDIRRRRDEAHNRLRNEALWFEEVCDFGLELLSVMYGVPRPPIYNCCPHSAYGLFPRITCEEGVEMLREPALVAG